MKGSDRGRVWIRIRKGKSDRKETHETGPRDKRRAKKGTWGGGERKRMYRKIKDIGRG